MAVARDDGELRKGLAQGAKQRSAVTLDLTSQVIGGAADRGAQHSPRGHGGGHAAVKFLGEIAIALSGARVGVKHQHQVVAGVLPQPVDVAAAIPEMQPQPRAQALEGQPVLKHQVEALQRVAQQLRGEAAGEPAEQQQALGIRGLGEDIGGVLLHPLGVRKTLSDAPVLDQGELTAGAAQGQVAIAGLDRGLQVQSWLQAGETQGLQLGADPDAGGAGGQ